MKLVFKGRYIFKMTLQRWLMWVVEKLYFHTKESIVLLINSSQGLLYRDKHLLLRIEALERYPGKANLFYQCPNGKFHLHQVDIMELASGTSLLNTADRKVNYRYNEELGPFSMGIKEIGTIDKSVLSAALKMNRIVDDTITEN